MWPDFDTARDIIRLYMKMFLPPESIEADKDTFKYRSDQRWALEDLIMYLYERWFDDVPYELICDYIDDCRYRAKKYHDRQMGRTYLTAKQTAEDILKYFVSEV
jgi:hypothetical protein